MLAIGLALSAAVAWGVGDFFGGLTARRLNVLAVVALSQLAGLAGIAAWTAAAGEGPPSGRSLLAAAGAGVAGAAGLAALYRGMAIGAIGIVAPLSAVSPVIPLAVDAARGDRPGGLQLAGVALALAGVVLASREAGSAGRRSAAGVGLALLAALSFGLYYVGIGEASQGGVAWAVLVARLASTTFAFGAAAATGAALGAGRRFLLVLAFVGLADVGANILFAEATTRGFVGVVSVVASLYPVITVALAAVVLRERLTVSQRGGAAIALAGATLISGG